MPSALTGTTFFFAVDDIDLFGLPRHREMKGGIVVLPGDLALLGLRVELLRQIRRAAGNDDVEGRRKIGA
jgi:hypothetical protein